MKVKIGEVDSEIDSTIGVRQGSCESPLSLHYTGGNDNVGVAGMCLKAGVYDALVGKTTGARASRVRGAYSIEFWTSLFAVDCILLFLLRDAISTDWLSTDALGQDVGERAQK